MGTPEHIYLDTFLVAGITTRTNNANEANPNSAQIPLLWMTFNTDEIANDIINQVANTPIYGVYHRYASDVNDDYSVTAGVAVIAPAVTAEDENIETIPVMAGNYLIFRAQGVDLVHTVITAWQEIWTYCSAHPEIKRAYQIDFEAYLGNTDGNHAIEIYIGVV